MKIRKMVVKRRKRELRELDERFGETEDHDR